MRNPRRRAGSADGLNRCSIGPGPAGIGRRKIQPDGNLLPRRSKVRAVKHHPALPYPQVGAFMAALRGRAGIAARALEFTILAAARTSEVLWSRWDEIDLQQHLWTVPAERMKASKEHRVPLSTSAITLIKKLPKAPEGPLVFPGADGAELSENA